MKLTPELETGTEFPHMFSFDGNRTIDPNRVLLAQPVFGNFSFLVFRPFRNHEALVARWKKAPHLMLCVSKTLTAVSPVFEQKRPANVWSPKESENSVYSKVPFLNQMEQC
eukprot:3689094-Amphidinium_carterae.1